MNRRQKKKQKVDHLAELKVRLEQIKAKLNSIDIKKMKTSITETWSSLPKLHQRLLMVISPIVLILLFVPLPEPKVDSAPITSRVELEINTVGLSEQQNAKSNSSEPSNWQEYLVKQGDTLAQVFRNNDLPLSDLNALVRIEGADKPLSQIRKGQLVRFKLAETGQLDILQLEKGDTSVMFFRLSDGGFGRSK
ncbi:MULTISPECIES: LysM-like peptidoglycan-binding domain-containing protein [Vibrio]|uniref:Lysine transporter LysM n=3 Tax=Vibrio cyclitrophicus TaxID=47951 RepID=A0A7Z1S211_9VIBR|nr:MULTISPECIES: LysM-like peptidoglycan-binding domain-containing protein [Vibrio]KNH10641.1 lysine transporter LysM [Vibrio lentus]MBY7661754.1 lysine transporter LysM [Vibrio atlanticus]ERM58779.1 putative cell envelope opacity-associated protein A [Vibrio cyclitrophicus FF75]KAA8598289.1 putative cell envelope opacity-associated protein A [Vibrio cyclitrophicus]MBE8607610.1 lysine transporter LysM [Vibrio sp. OPT10]|tara:strand:+ start:204 stop:782 length:579 start_codon:yes stop_codon:yes gene_type:complete